MKIEKFNPNHQLSIYDNGKISGLVRKILDNNDITPSVAAECIGCTLPSFRNKLSMDRFTIKELIILSELCGYHLALVPDNENQNVEYILSDEYISDEEKAKMDEYSKERLQKYLDILNTYMIGMSPEEKDKFLDEKLPGMVKGTNRIKPKE